MTTFRRAQIPPWHRVLLVGRMNLLALFGLKYQNGDGMNKMKCQHRGCTKSVPHARRKYCSDTCRRQATTARRLSMRKLMAEATSARRGSVVKHRTCLRCGKKFLSQGPWNRFCETCSHRNATIRCKRHHIPSDWPSSVKLDLERG